jgi:hypothetical protein
VFSRYSRVRLVPYPGGHRRLRFHTLMRTFARPIIRPLRDHEVPLANTWAIQEDWNPGPADALVFNTADPGSLLTIEVGGQPAGVISAARMSPGFGFAGFFVLAPEYRRSRFGWYLMQACLDRLEDRVIGVESVPERIHNYTHHGLSASHHTTAYRGQTPSAPARWQAGIGRALDIGIEQLAAYDAANFGVSRDLFLRAWLRLPDSLALVFKREDRVCGFGAVRLCCHGLRIGPLQADDPEAAEALFDALAGVVPGSALSVDCPAPNPETRALLLRKGLTPGFTTTRLYRGEPPRGRPERIYGLMSFSLG